MNDMPQNPAAPKPVPANSGQPATPPVAAGGGGHGKPGPAPVERPVADKAHMRSRHWGLVISFFVAVVLPFLVAAWYLLAVAEDRYGSVAGFIVRQEDSISAADVLGGLAQMAGGSVSGDSNILYKYIRSQNMVSRLDEEIDLRGTFSKHWSEDPLFALWPDATIEDLLWYWKRAVKVSFDKSSGLIEVEVIAFSPEEARAILEGIVHESERLINDLSERARGDAIRYAEKDLQDALVDLSRAREALTRFRTDTQLVDPESDLQVRMGVLANLQQQLASALVEYDVLVQGVANPETDPRAEQARRRISVIRNRISQERATLSTDEVASGSGDYPSLMAEYEGLVVSREYAEQRYRLLLAAADTARANADRETRYLGVYLKPSLPEKAAYPHRLVLLTVLFLFLLMSWGIGALIYYALRDRQ